MKTVSTLWLKGMLREPEAIEKNLGGSRTAKMLNLLLRSGTPAVETVHLTTQAIGSRRVSQNMLQFQALLDAQ